LTEILALDDIMLVLKQNVAMVWACAAKRRMKWKVTDQEVDQRGLGERLCKKTVKNREDAMNRHRWRKLIKDG